MAPSGGIEKADTPIGKRAFSPERKMTQMKRRKALHRGLALLLALVMSLGSSLTVLAAEPPSDSGDTSSVVVVPGEPGDPGEDGNTSEPDGSEPG